MILHNVNIIIGRSPETPNSDKAAKASGEAASKIYSSDISDKNKLSMEI